MTQEYDFHISLDLFSDDQCNISEYEANEGSETQQSKLLHLETSTHCNCISKFGRQPISRELKKFKSQGDPSTKAAKDTFDDELSGAEFNKNKRKLSLCLCKSTSKHHNMLLKDEVSMLLRKLINLKIKQKQSDLESFSFFVKEKSINIQNNNDDDQIEFVTMKDIEPGSN